VATEEQHGQLAGKVALVSGASSGIGEACAIRFAAEGAKVAVAARRGDRLNDLVARIEADGGEAFAIVADVTQESQAMGIVHETVARYGRLDILINSAGMTQAGGVESVDLDLFRKVFDLNLMGPMYTSRAAIPTMREQGSGDIINISSLAATKTVSGMTAYGTSKTALNTLTDGLRMEVGGYGIRVCTLMPGATKTEVADQIVDERVAENIRKHVSRPDAMEANDIADAVMFVLTMPRRAQVSVLAVRPITDTSA
jgi:NADP-dependent 3-hydroxy acid dehydrogenase YdfG